MAPPRPPRVRDRQRGNTMLIALVVLSALATLASLTVVSVQSSLKTSTNDRAQAIAMYAAESGAAVAMDFLRNGWATPPSPWNPSTQAATPWSNYVTPPGVAMPVFIPGNDIPPEDPSSLFTKDQNAWFHVDLLNNRDDPGYAVPLDFNDLSDRINDQDGRIIIRSTGHGPQDSRAIIEWEVQRLPTCPSSPPSPPVCGPLPSDSSWPKDPISSSRSQPLILRGWHIATPL